MEVRPDFDGEERIITFELCLNLDIGIYEEEKIDILSDVYGVVKEIAVSEKEASFCRFLSRSSGRMKLAEHFRGGENAQIVKILHTAGQLQMTDQTRVENGMEITGVVNLQILYECSKDEEKYGMLKENIPFHYVLETEEMDDFCECPVQGEVEQLMVSLIDGEEVDVKCVLFFRSNLYRKWKEKMVDRVTVSELDSEKMAALPGIAIYMVREGESLWDIGKRYYVPVSVIRQTNELTSDEVKCGDKILIVKNV